MGRPSSYTPEIAEEICERLAGGESLYRICHDEHMPSESTVRAWAIDDRDGFSAKYTRARDLGLDHVAEEVMAIADDASDDWETRVREDGSEYLALNSDHVNRSKLRFEARRWYLSKLAPKKYGDRQQLEHSGPGGEPLKITVERIQGRMD